MFTLYCLIRDKWAPPLLQYGKRMPRLFTALSIHSQVRDLRRNDRLFIKGEVTECRHSFLMWSPCLSMTRSSV